MTDLSEGKLQFYYKIFSQVVLKSLHAQSSFSISLHAHLSQQFCN